MAEPRAVVVDTNIVLDLLVFADPATVPLAAALAAGTVKWIATAGMRAELERVLGYPQLVPRLAHDQHTADAVLARFDAAARSVPPAPRAPVRCSDADDQPFIDLAVAHAALLLSKDRAVLSMRKRLLALGVTASSAIN